MDPSLMQKTCIQRSQFEITPCLNINDAGEERKRKRKKLIECMHTEEKE